MFWTSKEILSLDIRILDLTNKALVFVAEIKPQGNNSCVTKNKRKNKKKERNFNLDDLMCSFVCVDDDTDLTGGVEYQVDATARTASPDSTNESKSISYQYLNPPFKFKIADEATKYILSIKKRPKSFNVTSDNKVKLKAKIKSCEENSFNGTNDIVEGNGDKDLGPRRQNKSNSDNKLNKRNGNADKK